MSTELDRLAAGCLCPSFPGHEPPDWVLRWLARGLGGITLFAYNVGELEQVRRLTDALRAERPEVLVSIDEEGGDVTRLEARQGSSSPGNLALGAVDDVGLTREVAAAIADLLVAAGIDLNLAPVADVNTNPDNPVIGVRSFGSDPVLVARHVAAFVEGTQSRGVAACAKHFPGHGDTAVDSHLGLPVVEGELALEPFRAAVAAGVAAVMTGHLLVPALDEVPATVSGALVDGLLRGELGFTGLVVSDALEMGGISAGVGVDEGAVQALLAGVDLLCLGHDLHEEAAARTDRGRLPSARGCRELGRDPRRRGRAPGHGGPSARRPAARRRAPAGGEHRGGRARARAGGAASGLGRGHAHCAAGERSVAARRRTPLVLVLCDAARHEWQQLLARELVTLRPDPVVVETGIPGWTTPGAAATIETLGASRASLAAAAEVPRKWSVSGSNR